MSRHIAGSRRKDKPPPLRDAIRLFAKGVTEESKTDPSDTWDEGWNQALEHVVDMAYLHPLRWLNPKEVE